MVHSFEYDTRYPGPALPVVEIGLQGIDNQENSLSLRALVDSGADATFIPLRHLNRIGARKVDSRTMREASGLSYPVDIYEVTLQIGSYVVPKVYAAANKTSTELILGQDVLNYFVVTLNGLAYLVEISQ